MLANSCSWLSLYPHSLDYYVVFNSYIHRSLFFFHGDVEMLIPVKHLKILDFSQYLIRTQKSVINLSVPQWFEGLDDVVSTNLNLQTLIIYGINQSKLFAPTLHLPSKIWELQQSRHLELGDMYTLDPPSMVKEHLQTLSWTIFFNFLMH